MSNNSIIISTQLEKSANPGSIIVTDSNNKQKYIAPGSNGYILTSNGPGNEPTWQSSTLNSSFTITDGTTSQVVNSGDTLTITSGNGITATVSATDILTLLVKISTDANNDITIGTDGGIYLSKNNLLTNVTWNDATNNLVLTFDSGATVNVPIVDNVANFLFDLSISDGVTTDVVNNHETITFNGTNGLRPTVSSNQVSYGLRIQRDSFLGLTSGTTVTLTQTPLEILFVSRNGQIKLPGVGNDYTISGTTITFSTSFGPSVGGAGSENIQVNYTY